jgi:hypothetical protein
MLQSLARRVARTVGRDNPLIRAARPLYEALLDWTSGGRGIPWTINGVECRIDPRYRHMMGTAYDPHLAEWLSARVKPGDVSLDVGAAYNLNRRIALTGGVRYRVDQDRAATLADQRRDSQAVYVGTAFKF